MRSLPCLPRRAPKPGALATLAVLTALTAFAVAPATARAADFVYDDGTYEFGLGLIDGGAFTWANRFTAPAGGVTIQSISVAFADFTDPPINAPTINGTPFTAALWTDPNGDGNPSDAVLVSSLVSTVQNAQEWNGGSTPAVFAVYDLPDFTIPGGSNFFVGGFLTHGDFQNPATYDTSDFSNVGWYRIGSGFGGGATSLNPGFAGDFLVRASGVTIVPEPGTLFLAAMGGLALAGVAARRRRRTASTHA